MSGDIDEPGETPNIVEHGEKAQITSHAELFMVFMAQKWTDREFQWEYCGGELLL